MRAPDRAGLRGARGLRTTPRGCATHCAQVTVKRCGDLAGAAGGPHSNCGDRAVRRSGIEGSEYSLPGVAFSKYWFLSPSAKQTGAADGPRTSRAAPPGAGSPAGPFEACYAIKLHHGLAHLTLHTGAYHTNAPSTQP